MAEGASVPRRPTPDIGRYQESRATRLSRELKALGRDPGGLTEEQLEGELAKAKARGDVQSAPLTLPDPLDLTALAQVAPELIAFLLRDWLPCGYATLLAGHGGVGKSAIALYLAACIALGIPFFGVHVERRRVLYLSCEDRTSRLHLHLVRICAHLGIDLSELAGSLDVLDLVATDSVLWEKDPRTGDTWTPALGALQGYLEKRPAELVVVDGISDTFGGNENARTEVKRYINTLLSLVPERDGALLLVGHVAKLTASGTTQGREGYSGSTGWHNGVRARWYLYPETRSGEDGDTERTGDLILELQKSNLGPTDRCMRFRWDGDAGLFVGAPITPATALDRSARDRRERDGILAALESVVVESDYVPAATTGPRTAFHVLSAVSGFPNSLGDSKPERARFWRHIEALRRMDRLGSPAFAAQTATRSALWCPQAVRTLVSGHAGNEHSRMSRAMPAPANCGHAGNAAGGL